MSAYSISPMGLLLAVPFSQESMITPGVTPLLFSAAEGLSDEPLPPHPSESGPQPTESNPARRVQLLEEWMDRLERQWDQELEDSYQGELQVQFTRGSNKKCHRCQSTGHLVAACPTRRQCKACDKTGHKTSKCPARRRQEKEEWSISWDQQASLQNCEDWSAIPESPYPADRYCQTCRSTGYIIATNLCTGKPEVSTCTHPKEPTWGCSSQSPAWD